MLIYIVVFIISLWGVRETDVRYEERSYRILFSLIAVLPPILLAGFRDSTVGTDMVVYILPLFEEQAIAQQELGTFIDTNDLEILYLILNYIVAKITDSPFVLLLLIHTLIIIPLYVTAMKWREWLSPVLFMLVFYMIFFQESLSIVRQSIALSFSLLAFTLFVEKKYIVFFVYAIIAFFFHQTAVIALSIPLIYLAVDKYSIREYYLYYIGVILLVMSIFLNLDTILIWLIDGGYIDLKFLRYTSADNAFTPVLGATNFVVKIVTIAYFILIMFFYKSDTILKFFLIVAVLDMLFSLCALIVQPLDRISLYYRLMTCISIPYIIYNYPIIYSDDETPYTRPIEGLFCVLLFAYWFYVYMLGNYDDTADYQISSTLFI